jgi:hypothetical protein
LIPGLFAAPLIIMSNDPVRPVFGIPAVIELGTVSLHASEPPEAVDVSFNEYVRAITIICSTALVRQCVFDNNGRLRYDYASFIDARSISLGIDFKGIIIVELLSAKGERFVRRVLTIK